MYYRRKERNERRFGNLMKSSSTIILQIKRAVFPKISEWRNSERFMALLSLALAGWALPWMASGQPGYFVGFSLFDESHLLLSPGFCDLTACWNALAAAGLLVLLLEHSWRHWIRF
ncbi:hypothetical protein M5K25_001801 [Dendrobium thyrsiflorum]|uniref:Uncharacterized protein n=1 Tax=Dendrobium thyrsiflorum TaxID=117978 RepID=A0ABD0VZJ1_DENTH